jgi:hypothetical protein
MADIEGPSIRRLRDPSSSLSSILPSMSINRQVLALKVCQPTEEIARFFDPDQISGNWANCFYRPFAI